MQASVNSSNNQDRPWLDIVETVSVVGSIGSSIAAILINQAALASIPLSITVMLNLVNRRLQLEAISKTNQSAVSQLIQADEANNQQIAQLQQLTIDYPQVKGNIQEHCQDLQSFQSAIASMRQEQSETQEKLYAIGVQQTQFGSDFSQLKNETQEYTHLLQQAQLGVAELLQSKAKAQIIVDSIAAQQMKIVRKVDYLHEIDSSTQAIRIAPYDADAYYKRGLSFQALGDDRGSISDFSEVIKLNSSHASAYYNRGLAHIELGNKKRAVQDLREAAKLFFEAGDITNYQIAKDSSKQIHELNSSVSVEEDSLVAVGSLFA